MEYSPNSYRNFIKIMNRLTAEEKFLFLYNYIEWLYVFLGYGISRIKPKFADYTGELSNKSINTVLCNVDDIELYQVKNYELIILEEIINIRKKNDLNTLSSINNYKNEVINLINELFFKQIKNEELHSKLFKIINIDYI